MFRSLTSLGLARLAMAAVQAICLVVVARFVDVATFGALSVIIAVVSFAFITASAGLPQYILRERALRNDSGVRSALTANLVTSVIGVAVLTTIAVFVEPISVAPIAIGLIIAVAVDKNIDCSLSVVIADGRMRAVSSSILGRAVATALTFVVILVPSEGSLPVESYVVARLIASAAGAAHLVLIRRRIDAPRMPARDLVAAAWPLATANFAAAVRSLDSFVVFLAGGTATAGLYSAATRPFAPAAIVAGAAGSVLMPRAATMDAVALGARTRRLELIVAATTIALGPLAFLGPWVVVLVYGPDYVSAGTALGISLVMVPAVISAAIASTILQARGFERFVVVNSFLFLLVFLVLVAAGALVAGATGAALGSALSVWGRNIGLYAGLRRLVRREAAG